MVTLGNHAWDQREALVFIERAPQLVRPLNYPRGHAGPRRRAGRGQERHARARRQRAWAASSWTPLDDPFAALDRELAACPAARAADAIIVDFHGEATSEKQAMGYFCDGRASLVVGTHTHVPTADHQILAGGTAFMTDAGMTGDYDSGDRHAEGRAAAPVPRPAFHQAASKPAGGVATLSGVAVETDDATGLALRVAPVRAGGRLEPARAGVLGLTNTNAERMSMRRLLIVALAAFVSATAGAQTR